MNGPVIKAQKGIENSMTTAYVPLAALLEFIKASEHYCPTCSEEFLDTYIDAHELRLFLQQYNEDV